MPRKPIRANGVKRLAVKVDSQTTVKMTASAPAELNRPMVKSEVRDSRFRLGIATMLGVGGLLVLHYALAARSLLLENPTVDEVVHMPAGITYWQKGTFRLYHHNPPLVKLVAALPVVWANPVTEPLYQMSSWKTPDPSQTTFSQTFAFLNRARYFELFQLARLMMPLFSIIGGLVVFAWSRRLYGTWGGLLSLSLWVFCPNILAHARLVTSDVGSTAMGVAATYVFWRYLHQPNWRWAAAAGILLGLAQLTKFTMLLLYAVWPFLWLVRLLLVTPHAERTARISPALGHGFLIVLLSIVTIDAGYFFEGVGIPLGKFEFASSSLTRPVSIDAKRPHSKNLLLEAAWQFRVNRIRGTWLDRLPCPMPEHYVLGFDEQKIETEGIPERFTKAVSEPNEAIRDQMIARERAIPESPADAKGAYPVYLNGELRRTGWWYYYLLALFYKLPEGTLILAVLSLLSLRFVRHSRAEWADEIALWTLPVVILFSMSFLTDINLGLRVRAGYSALCVHLHGQARPFRAVALTTQKMGADRACGQFARLDDRGIAMDSPALSGVLQLGVGGTGPHASPVDRQQPRLGARPDRTTEVVEKEHPRPVDRPGVLRSDQSVDIQTSGRGVRLVSASRTARDNFCDGG